MNLQTLRENIDGIFYGFFREHAHFKGITEVYKFEDFFILTSPGASHCEMHFQWFHPGVIPTEKSLSKGQNVLKKMGVDHFSIKINKNDESRNLMTKFPFKLMYESEFIFYKVAPSTNLPVQGDIRFSEDLNAIKHQLMKGFGFDDIGAENLCRSVYFRKSMPAYNYLAFRDDEACGMGNLTQHIDDKEIFFANGACLDESHRGQGLYRDLVHARINQVARLGGGCVLVESIKKTSLPILLKLNFSKSGAESLIYEYRQS